MASTETQARRWLWRLERQLDARRPDIDLFEAYYDGEHRLAFATAKFVEAFGSLFSAFADNWCDLVVDAVVERLHVEGFRFGDSDDADSEAWEIWQANGLDAQSTIAHRTAVTCGEAYLLVAPPNRPQTGHDEPVITVEHPACSIVECAGANPRLRLAALKKWVEDDEVLANVYLPDAVWKFRRRAKGEERETPSLDIWTPTRGHSSIARQPAWDLREQERTHNPLGVVSMVPLVNKPDVYNRGRSRIKQVIPVQDAINKLFTDLLVNSEYVAFPQRWATGIAPQIDPETGDELPHKQFIANVARMWVTGDHEAKFGALPSGDLTWHVKALEMAVQHVAARTRTPPHYLLGQSGTFPSGESLKSTETGLVAVCHDTAVPFGDSHEETQRLAFKAKGDDVRAGDLGAETIWRDPESRSEAERVDALSKLRTLGVPEKVLWEKSGMFTQREIARMSKLRAAEERRALTLGLGGFNPSADAQNVPDELDDAEGE